MECIKKITFKTYSLILRLMMHFFGLLGFGLLYSCTTKYGAPYAEYGVLTEGYVNFKGEVKSADSLKPIKNISVKLSTQPDDTSYTHTSTTGFYNLTKYVSLSQNIKMIFTDIDGNLNGNFYPHEISLTVNYEDIAQQSCEIDVYLQRKP